MYKKLRYFIRAVRIRLSHMFGVLTVKWRKTPDFLIIGAQKGGTSSLFYYFKFHPSVKRPIKKEIHYFNINFDKGLNWYKAHFPFKSNNKITGEASPDYIYHPGTPQRVKALNPEMKLILLVRDPIQRAYSAYQMNKRMGIDPRKTFEDAIQFELNHRIEEKMEYNYERHNYFYLDRGLYAKQLENWTKVFDKDQLLVIPSKEFFVNTAAIMQRIFRFLKIEEVQHTSSKSMNVGKYPPLSQEIYAKLKDYYEEDAALLKSKWNIEFE